MRGSSSKTSADGSGSRFGVTAAAERTAVCGVSASAEFSLAMGPWTTRGSTGRSSPSSPGGGYQPPSVMPQPASAHLSHRRNPGTLLPGERDPLGRRTARSRCHRRDDRASRRPRRSVLAGRTVSVVGGLGVPTLKRQAAGDPIACRMKDPNWHRSKQVLRSPFVSGDQTAITLEHRSVLTRHRSHRASKPDWLTFRLRRSPSPPMTGRLARPLPSRSRAPQWPIRRCLASSVSPDRTYSRPSLAGTSKVSGRVTRTCVPISRHDVVPLTARCCVQWPIAPSHNIGRSSSDQFSGE